jgi:hypothetical protein
VQTEQAGVPNFKCLNVVRTSSSFINIRVQKRFDGMLYRAASHFLSPGQVEGVQQLSRVGLPEAQSAVSPSRQEEAPRKKQGGRQVRSVAQAEGLDLRGPSEGGGRKQADLQEGRAACQTVLGGLIMQDARARRLNLMRGDTKSAKSGL